MTQRMASSAYTQEPGAIWDALVHLRHPTVLAKGHRAQGRQADLQKQELESGAGSPRAPNLALGMVFGQPSPALTHTYKMYIIKSISHSINHGRYFQILGFHVSSGGNLSSISTLRAVLETHYLLHWHFQACWSTQLARAPCSHPCCSHPLLHPLFFLQLYHRLQEKKDFFFCFFLPKERCAKCRRQRLSTGQSCAEVYGALRGCRRGWHMKHQQLWGSITSESQSPHGKAGYF